MTIYGEVEVDRFNFTESEDKIFADGPYSYGIYHIKSGEALNLPQLTSMTVFVWQVEASGTVTIDTCSDSAERGDVFQLEGIKGNVCARSSTAAALLISGVTHSALPKGIKLIKHSNIKKVTKPWGHELWLSNEHPHYAFKEIYIKAPHKTSLQYHNYKEETNILFSGTAKLHYKSNTKVTNDDVTAADVSAVELGSGTAISVAPPVLHRIEAVTDVLLYETSTPHLDDVIRVDDDSKRPDGRIATEHRV